MTGWIFESLTLAKNDAAPQACEDRVLVLPPDFAAVIDGATDISGERYGGRTGGALAAEAIAAVFTQAWSACRQGGTDTFATAADALALADGAIAALYARFGLSDVVLDPARRFRAAFAVASRRGGFWRGVGVGDCALRIDDAQPVLRDHPAEAVFAAWRAAMIAADAARPEAAIRAALVGGWAQADPAARKAADGIAFADPVFARGALSTGLAGMRAARPGDALAFGVADGVGDMGHDFCWQVLSPDTEAQALALWTDGWLSPGGQTIESWLTAADATHAEDPRRIGKYRCVKGPQACGRHDDMGIVLIRRV
ncbi:hypothetical protein [Roseisalinus antarcticus]|uniref:PPM-type phosphatase domain-containing protein n=1 Tax=Roseisalinus antarcticus TaxID=254357 RepID=A0A1Y5TWP8_9RHOB|nr:hypothetical protein [Roseisalinus antarcticus]SLN75049.1 hypothetical protein ROA7023_03881 [Roseisalinus antarcticus]